MEIKEDELQLLVQCKNSEEKEKVLALLEGMSEKLFGSREKREYCIELRDIIYFECVDKKTFIYTKHEAYESQYRLYELEERLRFPFLRISRSCILNMNEIRSLKADLGGRVMCVLENEEHIRISRQYAGEFKRKLRGEQHG